MNATKRCWIDPLDRGHYHRRQTKIRQESSRGKNSQRRNHTAVGLRLVAAVQWQSLERARAWDPGSEGTARNRRVSGVMHWNPSRAAWRCRMRSRTKNPRKRSGMPRQETPRCAMANWGLAMTEYHQLWEPYAGPTELQRGSAEIQRARVLKPGTPAKRITPRHWAFSMTVGSSAATRPAPWRIEMQCAECMSEIRRIRKRRSVHGATPAEGSPCGVPEGAGGGTGETKRRRRGSRGRANGRYVQQTERDTRDFSCRWINGIWAFAPPPGPPRGQVKFRGR